MHFLKFIVGIKRYIFFISVINQLDAQNFYFKISLFHASTYCKKKIVHQVG